MTYSGAKRITESIAASPGPVQGSGFSVQGSRFAFSVLVRVLGSGSGSRFWFGFSVLVRVLGSGSRSRFWFAFVVLVRALTPTVCRVLVYDDYGYKAHRGLRCMATCSRRVSGISCVGHNMRSHDAPQTESVDA